LNDDTDKWEYKVIILGGSSSSNDGTPEVDYRVITLCAKVVINATGTFSDAIRKMDDQSLPPIIKPAAGTHIVLPAHFSPAGTGMTVLETTNGREIFYLHAP